MGAAAQRIEVPDGDKQALIKRCRRVFFALGWQHPFFYPAISYLTFDVGLVRTACVRLDGRITVDPRFAATLSDDELAGVIAHEVSHLLYLHFARRGNREHRRWNRAGDRALNSILHEARITLPQGALLPERDQWGWSAEDLYNAEPEALQGGDGGQPGSGGDDGDDNRVAVGQGCGVDPAPQSAQGDQDDDADGTGGAGDGDGGDGDGDGPGGGAENADRHVGQTPSEQSQVPDWGYVAAQCAASAQSAGGESGRVLRRLTVSPPSRVRWDSILRRAVTQALMAHGRDDNTWQRRSRRSQVNGPLYPGHTAYKTRVAVVIDTSGSMGDKAIADAISNTVKIARVADCRIYLVGHTSRAYFAEWIEGRLARAPQLEEFLSQSGGTSFVDAFARVEAQRCQFDAVVQLTDGECRWPNPPKPRNCRRQVIALLGMSERSYAPDSAEVIEASID